MKEDRIEVLAGSHGEVQVKLDITSLMVYSLTLCTCARFGQEFLLACYDSIDISRHVLCNLI